MAMEKKDHITIDRRWQCFDSGWRDRLAFDSLVDYNVREGDYGPRRTQGGIAKAIANPNAQPSIPWTSGLCEGMKTLRRRGEATGRRWLAL